MPEISGSTKEKETTSQSINKAPDALKIVDVKSELSDSNLSALIAIASIPVLPVSSTDDADDDDDDDEDEDDDEYGKLSNAQKKPYKTKWNSEEVRAEYNKNWR
jgi:hypothetical protein